MFTQMVTWQKAGEGHLPWSSTWCCTKMIQTKVIPVQVSWNFLFNKYFIMILPRWSN